MVATFSDAAVTFSGGGFNHFASTLIKEVIDLGFLAENIDALKKEYSKRSESMNFALTKYFGDLISYTVPDGGYYYWLNFDLEFDTQDFGSCNPSYTTNFDYYRGSWKLKPLS